MRHAIVDIAILHRLQSGRLQLGYKWMYCEAAVRELSSNGTVSTAFHSLSTMSASTDSLSLPDSNGPRLAPFSGQIGDIQFLRLLSPKEAYGYDGLPHSRVFHVKLNGQNYALKVVGRFNARRAILKYSN